MNIRYLFLVPAFTCLFATANAQGLSSRYWPKGPAPEFGLNYNGLVPVGMHGGMSLMSGPQGYLGVRIIKRRLLLGVETGLASQPSLRRTQDWSMNGQAMSGEVEVTSRLKHHGLYSRFYFTDRRGLNYYVTGGAGYATSRSSISVYDADYGDDCEVLEDRLLQKQRTWYRSAGAGITMATGWIPDERNRPTVVQLDFSIRYIRTNPVAMINLRHVHDAGSVGNDKPVNMQFVNLRTNVVHTHRVATMRTAPLDGLMLNLGVSIAWGRKLKPRP